MKALDVMQRERITATAETAIDDAVRLMVANHISGLPVVDSTGALLGILSEGDLLRRTELGTEAKVPSWIGWLTGQGRAAREYVREHARKVGEIMTAPAISSERRPPAQAGLKVCGSTRMPPRSSRQSSGT